MTWVIICTLLYLTLSNGVKAQRVGINATGAPPDTSAALDIDITTGGLLIPRLTTTQRDNITSPAFSLMIFNITDSCLQIYSGVNWENIYCLGDTACVTPAAPGAITGNDTVCGGTVGELYSIAAVAGATAYNWTVPAGATIASGQGADSITIDWGSASGNVSVTASNSCDSSAASVLVVTVNSAPAAPTAGTHAASDTQIVWNWNTVAGAAGYKYNTVNDYATATDNGASVTYTQTGLTCNTPDTLYVWAYNACGNSTATALNQSTDACEYVCGQDGTFVDARDGQTYGYVDIGTQRWMCENLNYGTYVPIATGQGGAGTQKYCYNDNTANCDSLGGLYEWDEMMDGSPSCNGTGPPPDDSCVTPVQGVCPAGWHVPSHYEWTTLEKNVGTDPGAFPYDITTTGWLGTDEGGNMKVIPICGASPCWNTPNTGATNSSGFTALSGGNSWAGTFANTGVVSYWWSSTEKTSPNVWYRYLHASMAQINRINGSKVSGYSVRCVQD